MQITLCFRLNYICLRLLRILSLHGMWHMKNRCQRFYLHHFFDRVICVNNPHTPLCLRLLLLMNDSYLFTVVADHTIFKWRSGFEPETPPPSPQGLGWDAIYKSDYPQKRGKGPPPPPLLSNGMLRILSLVGDTVHEDIGAEEPFFTSEPFHVSSRFGDFHSDRIVSCFLDFRLIFVYYLVLFI